jgi:hypothetical protein
MSESARTGNPQRDPLGFEAAEDRRGRSAAELSVLFGDDDPYASWQPRLQPEPPSPRADEKGEARRRAQNLEAAMWGVTERLDRLERLLRTLAERLDRVQAEAHEAAERSYQTPHEFPDVS